VAGTKTKKNILLYGKSKATVRERAELEQQTIDATNKLEGGPGTVGTRLH
jgi:hypothetical protein